MSGLLTPSRLFRRIEAIRGALLCSVVCVCVCVSGALRASIETHFGSRHGVRLGRRSYSRRRLSLSLFPQHTALFLSLSLYDALFCAHNVVAGLSLFFKFFESTALKWRNRADQDTMGQWALPDNTIHIIASRLHHHHSSNTTKKGGGAGVISLCGYLWWFTRTKALVFGSQITSCSAPRSPSLLLLLLQSVITGIFLGVLYFNGWHDLYRIGSEYHSFITYRLYVMNEWYSEPNFRISTYPLNVRSDWRSKHCTWHTVCTW